MKHLLPYLPYGLKAMVGNIEKDVLMHQNYSSNYQIWFMILLGDAQVVAKPILKPLTELLDNSENHRPFLLEHFEQCRTFCLFEDEREIDFGNLTDYVRNALKEDYFFSYKFYEYMFENHIDIFGLIDKGLAAEEKIKEKASTP